MKKEDFCLEVKGDDGDDVLKSSQRIKMSAADT